MDLKSYMNDKQNLQKNLKEVLFTKRMQAAQGSLEKPVELRQLRREIARMKTVLNEKEMDGEK